MPKDWGKLNGVRAVLENLRGRADASFARVAAEHPEAVACRPGCDDCCHALFDLAPVEALAIALAFSDLPRKQRRDIQRRAQKAARLFDQAAAQALAVEGEERLRILSQARTPCPLLADGRCAVYDERPITCRLYGIPVNIGGQGRTCRLARFQPGESYPTADMDQVQSGLLQLSRQAAALVPGLPAKRLDAARSIALDARAILAG